MQKKLTTIPKAAQFNTQKDFKIQIKMQNKMAELLWPVKSPKEISECYLTTQTTPKNLGQLEVSNLVSKTRHLIKIGALLCINHIPIAQTWTAKLLSWISLSGSLVSKIVRYHLNYKGLGTDVGFKCIFRRR